MLDVTKRQNTAPFDTALLDRLMDEAGIDVLVATSKHNIQYLLGGHRAFFFESMDAMGLSRYLPVFVYQKGAPQKAGFFGHRMEGFQNEVKPFWVSEVNTKSSGAVDVMEKAVDYLRRLVPNAKRIAIETAFIPLDSAAVLRKAFPNAETVDALFVLERLRARKTPQELEMLKIASDAVIDSMEAVFQEFRPRRHQERADRSAAPRGNAARPDLRLLPDRGRSESQSRAVGPALGEGRRALDRFRRQLSRLYRRRGAHGRCRRARCRVGRSVGRVEAIEQAAMKPIRAGVLGSEIYAAADTVLHTSKLHNHIHFLAHGMGLVSHEAPRLTNSGPVPYDAYDAPRPLETGMVVSVETTLQHPRRGFIKLEDTVIVQPDGFEVYGDRIRGWNRAGRGA